MLSKVLHGQCFKSQVLHPNIVAPSLFIFQFFVFLIFHFICKYLFPLGNSSFMYIEFHCVCSISKTQNVFWYIECTQKYWGTLGYQTPQPLPLPSAQWPQRRLPEHVGRNPPPLCGRGMGAPAPWWGRMPSAAMLETRVRSLGREDPLEKEMATHSNTLAWKIPWTEEPDRLQSMGLQRVWHDLETSLSLSLSEYLWMNEGWMDFPNPFTIFFHLCLLY